MFPLVSQRLVLLGALGGLLAAQPRPTLAQTTAIAFEPLDTVRTKNPVQLVYIRAWQFRGRGQLHWVTATEQNSARFSVERSRDGQAWTALATRAAHPGSTTPTGYEYEDPDLGRYGAPVLHYRLRQIARDSTSTYSPVCVVRLGTLIPFAQEPPSTTALKARR